MATLKTLDDLFVHGLKDIYSAEKQLLKALPKMAKAASCEKLRAGFEEHLEQTLGHVDRLETIFKSLDASGRGVKCKAMEGLVEEGAEMIDEDAEPAVKDAGLIAAAQKVEHYEIASYGTLAAFAEHLGHTEAVDLLRQTLAEERETDEKLTQLAESEINVSRAGLKSRSHGTSPVHFRSCAGSISERRPSVTVERRQSPSGMSRWRSDGRPGF